MCIWQWYPQYDLRGSDFKSVGKLVIKGGTYNHVSLEVIAPFTTGMALDIHHTQFTQQHKRDHYLVKHKVLMLSYMLLSTKVISVVHAGMCQLQFILKFTDLWLICRKNFIKESMCYLLKHYSTAHLCCKCFVMVTTIILCSYSCIGM